MDILVTGKMLNLLMIATTFSIILMATIQKFKTLSFINKTWHIFLLNLILSFLIGIFFAQSFYDLSLEDSIWVSIFSFIGAPAIYQTLKKQNIINYTPKALDDCTSNVIKVPKENEIIR